MRDVTEIKKVENLILKHKALYYQGKAEISDEMYDRLEAWMKKNDPENPVLSIVGSPVAHSNEKVKHDKKMLSLDKTYDIQALKKWIGKEQVISLFKLDGSSCSLIYENGRLVMAKTRGDGKEGENITPKAMFIPSIPKTTRPDSYEVRGEIYCTQQAFNTLCEEMVSLGLDKPSSLRNIVAGLLGRKEHTHLARHLSFQAFDLITSETYIHTYEHEKLLDLKTLGFAVPEYSLAKPLERLEMAKSHMEQGEYLIDGVVFIYDKIAKHDELGETSHHPRYKMAFKFEGDSQTTKIESISWQVSRNGRLTPVANVEPVELSGAMVGRVTLHNYGVVKANELKAGDAIEIIRSGEVIPKFLSVVTSACGDFETLKDCPSCGQKLRVDDIWLMCDNDYCPDKLLEGIVHFAAKIGIDDVSDKRLNEMINKGLINYPYDLYTMKVEDFMKLDKVKDKMATKMFTNIQKTLSPTLPQFVAALGLDGLATSGTEKLMAAGYETIEAILNLTVTQMTSIEGFAEKSATAIVESIKAKTDLINKLVEIGMKIKIEEKIVSGTGLAGKSFCITGALSKPRPQIEKQIKEHGGSIGSVSKNLSYLVTNETDGSSSKFVKAKKLGVSIINEEALYKLMG